MAETRTDFKTGVSESIYSNTSKLIKGNTVRDKFLVMADSVLYFGDADIAGGYLSIDSSDANVDVSFIKATSATGKFLKDNGSWALLTADTIAGTFLLSSGHGIDNVATGGSDVLNIGVTNANVINYGNSSTQHNFLGTAIYENQVNSYVTDKLITLNSGGAAASAIGVGLEIEESASISGYFKTNSARNGFSLKSPANSYKVDLNTNLLSADQAITIPNVSGSFLVGTFSDTQIPYAESGAMAFSSSFYYQESYKRLMVDQVVLNSATASGVVLNNISIDNKIQFYRSGGSIFTFCHEPGGFYFYDNTTVQTVFYITNGDNFGINTTSVSSKFVVNGKSYLGTDGTATAFVDLAASTTSNASLRVRNGSNPTSPNNGDVWYTTTNGFRLWAEGRSMSVGPVATGYNGIYLAQTPSSTNPALYGDDTSTLVNASSLTGFEVGGSTKLSVNATSITNYVPLTLVAGTTGGGPLVMVSGSLKSSPAAGSLEFLTDRLYFTKTTGPTRETVAFLSDIPSVSGSDTYIQYNSSGVLGASSRFIWDNTNFYFKAFATCLFGMANSNNPTAVVDIAASTSARASLRIRTASAAPSSPNDGDIWQDGTDIKIRIGGVTKRFSLI